MSLVLHEHGQPYLNFINSLKSQPTKEQYRKMLLNFMSHNKIVTLKSLLSLIPKDIGQMLTNYITNLNARGLSYGYVNLAMCALFHFFDMNDVLLNKRKIKKFIGEHKKVNKDRAYTHAEIKKLVDTRDFRFKALILLLAATGVRIGSISGILLKHCEKRSNLYKVTVYENTNEEYYCFTTPEAAQAIDQYLDFRRRAGESLKPDSPLFRNDFNANAIAQVRKNSRPVDNDTFRNIIHSRLQKVGLIEKSDTGIRTRRHHPVAMSHGFRKFATTQMVNARIRAEIREMLLGHKIGLASAYYRPTEDEMLEEFEKAIDHLTINPENRLRRKVEKLEVEKNQFERLAAKISAIEAKIR